MLTAEQLATNYDYPFFIFLHAGLLYRTEYFPAFFAPSSSNTNV